MNPDEQRMAEKLCEVLIEKTNSGEITWELDAFGNERLLMDTASLFIQNDGLWVYDKDENAILIAADQGRLSCVVYEARKVRTHQIIDNVLEELRIAQ